MAGDSEQVSQDEIEELLKAAKAAARSAVGPTASNPAPASAAPATANEVVGQNEIEALMAGMGKQNASALAAKPMSQPEQTIGQNEIEALMAGMGKAPSAAAQAVAAPPKAPPAPPKPAPAPQAARPARTADDINFLLTQAEEALASVANPTAPKAGAAPFTFRDFGASPPSDEKATFELLREVELDLRIELGRTHMPLEDVLKLRKGSVVALDKLAGDPVDVYVNGRLVARGEVLVLNDNFCVRVAELLSGEEVKAA